MIALRKVGGLEVSRFLQWMNQQIADGVAEEMEVPADQQAAMGG